VNKCKFCWAVAAALAILLSVLASKFLPVGNVEISADGRTVVVVAPAERDMILAEMRGLLEAVQTIIVANNAGDLNAVAVAGRKVGRENMSPKSAEFVARLPMDFRKLGMDTHVRFDQLALDATRFENTDHVSQQLGELIANCVDCHKVYRLVLIDQE
jgi:hypothetical protein